MTLSFEGFRSHEPIAYACFVCVKVPYTSISDCSESAQEYRARKRKERMLANVSRETNPKKTPETRRRLLPDEFYQFD